MQDLVVGKIKINTLLAFAFGTVFLVVTLMVRLAFPMSNDAETAVQVTSALAAAAIAAGIPGLFQFSVSSPGKALTIRATGSLIVFLIVLSMNASRAETVAAIEATLIFFTPLLLRHGLRKYRVRIGRPSLVLLSALMVIGEAAFFSETAGAGLPNLPSGYPIQSGIFAGYDLKNSAACRSCQQHMWIRENDRFVRKEVTRPVLLDIESRAWGGNPPDKHTQLHLLLAVEWRKWEMLPMLERDYQGHIYYTVDYKCNVDRIDVYSAKLVGYKLAPGKRPLSWLIGFVEIPFTLDVETMDGKIEQKVRETSRLCAA